MPSNWVSLGPTVSAGGYAGHGRINAIGFHPSNSQIIYAGASGGGLWKTTNGGSTWSSFHWSIGEQKQASELFLKLNIHRKDPWLNDPTHPDYDQRSMFDVFELSGISTLDEKIRESVGFRISAQIMQEIGEEDASNQKQPILFICDEMREINKHFPAIQELIAEATVTGRKEGLVTVLFSQAYEHFTGTPEQPNITGIDLVKNSGVKIVGKQIGGFERLADDCELASETISAIRAIRNQYGRYTQWVFVIGSGGDKIIQMAEIHLSPVMIWAYTNDTNEANARG